MVDVRDTRLALRGRTSHEWAYRHMQTLEIAAHDMEKARPLAGLTVGFCLQVTAETSVLVAAAMRLGARAVVCSGNPHTTQDDIAAYLVTHGASVFAWRDQSRAEFRECVARTLDESPDILVDDGAELSALAHSQGCDSVMGGTEETTTGVTRMRSISRRTALLYPIIAVNDARTKRTFDNTYGTGQSTIDALLRTGVMIASKIVIVAGYGRVGRGVAARCRGLGARVTITEVDPVKALEAHMDGYDVMRMTAAAKLGEIFVTCTGQKSVITVRHINAMRDGAIIANAGHFDVEVDVAHLLRAARRVRRVRENLDEITLGDKRVLLSSRGYVANLVAASGNAPEIMALSFCNQLYCIVHLARHASTMEHTIHAVPHNIDVRVARNALRVGDVKIDSA